MQIALHLLFMFEGVQGYKDCLNKSFSIIQLCFCFSAVTKTSGARGSDMRPLSRFECSVTRYQIVSSYFVIILDENKRGYHKSSCFICILNLSLTDASVKPDFNSFTDSLTTQIFNKLWKTETPIRTFLSKSFSMPC